MEPSVWQECLQCLRERIPQQQFSQWISPLQVEIARHAIVLFAPNKYICDEVTCRYLPLFEETVNQFKQGEPISVSVVIGVKSSLSKKALLEEINADNLFCKEENTVAYKSSALAKKKVNFSHNNNLNNNFKFENFIEGKSNQLAKAAASQIAKNPGIAYNPLYLYGGVGLGKTHLMHAVGNYIISKTEQKVVYMHSEKFVADMVKALQANAIDEFKKFYRNVDVLLIDDVQFLAGKDHSQEEFFHTFNTLVEENKQIILTSDRFPKEIYGIEDRLKSRFSSGLTVVVEPPELETRVAILINKAEDANVVLQQEIAFFIAKRIRSNVRELEGALKRIIANSQFTGNSISLGFVQEILRDLLDFQEKTVSVENIIKTVCQYYKIKPDDLLSSKRNRCFVRPRQIAMTLCKDLTSHSLPEIGLAFKGKDHTTVLHACRQIYKLKEVNTEVFEDYVTLYRTLSS